MTNSGTLGNLKGAVSKVLRRIEKLNNNTVRLNKRWFGTATANILSYAMLIALSAIFLAPFIYMISGSLMSAEDIANVNVFWIPTQFVTDNYEYAYMVMDYLPRLLSSSLYTLLAVLGQVLSCALVGYSLARFQYKLRGLFFGLVIFSLVIPPQTLIVSQYVMFSRSGLSDSWWPIILPCFFSLGLNGGLFTFIFRQSFRGLPRELEDAAMIDGLGFFRTFFQIVIPSSASSMLVVSILSLIWQWNNYFEPSIYLRSSSKYSLTMMLSSSIWMETSQQGISYTSGILLAATVLASLPVILIFFILQRRFIRGIETAGLAN